mmetsp:Transcript_92365/g.263868  ORF Transcript_92365/g.263868 Transcript_92365/m.263868 type:complete len:219 (-) Transcript_92365:615-1271(-)
MSLRFASLRRASALSDSMRAPRLPRYSSSNPASFCTSGDDGESRGGGVRMPRPPLPSAPLSPPPPPLPLPSPPSATAVGSCRLRGAGNRSWSKPSPCMSPSAPPGCRGLSVAKLERWATAKTSRLAAANAAVALARPAPPTLASIPTPLAPANSARPEAGKGAEAEAEAGAEAPGDRSPPSCPLCGGWCGGGLDGASTASSSFTGTQPVSSTPRPRYK